MREMKDSGIDWIGEIPAHWEVKRFKSFAKTIKGKSFNTLVEPLEGSYKVLSVECLRQDEAQFYDYVFVDDEKQICTTNDIVVIWDGAGVGEFLKAKKGVLSSTIAKIQLTNKSVILPYLWYWRYKIEYRLKSIPTGMGIPHLNPNLLNNFKIAIPPIEEQQSIADYLDKKTAEIDEQITLLEQKQNAYAKLKQSLISQVITRGLNPNAPLKDSGIDWIGEIPAHWEVKRLKDVAVLNPNLTGEDLTGNVSFVPMESLRCGQIDFQDIQFAEAKGKYTYFADEDLLIAKVTPCFENGNIALAKNMKQGVGFGSSEIFVLRCFNISNGFLFYYSLSNQFQGNACATMCGVGGLKRISPLFMRTYQFAIPPIEEQQAIADYLDKKTADIDENITLIDQKINAYKRLKQSLIDEVVTGKRKIQ